MKTLTLTEKEAELAMPLECPQCGGAGWMRGKRGQVPCGWCGDYEVNIAYRGFTPGELPLVEVKSDFPILRYVAMDGLPHLMEKRHSLGWYDVPYPYTIGEEIHIGYATGEEKPNGAVFVGTVTVLSIEPIEGPIGYHEEIDEVEIGYYWRILTAPRRHEW